MYLTDLSEASLATAARANLLVLMRTLADLPGGVHGDGWLRWRTSVPHPWFSGVLSERPARAGDGALVADTKAALDASGWPWTWWLGPDATGWEPLLVAAGLQAETPTPEMAVDLNALPWDDPLPEGLTITEPSTADERRVWVETVVAGFGMPAFAVEPFVEIVETLEGRVPSHYVLGWLDGRPVATSGAIEAAGVAGIYYVATLPEARRRGIGAALTCESLRTSRDNGCRIGILQASSMGRPVYERLGFRVVGSVAPFAPTAA